MSHPDEGTIQMLLDGELDPGEQARIESHIAACAPCTARLAEARGFLEEADRLVEVLAVPHQPAKRRGSPTRRSVVRTLAWAASIVVAVGVGYWGRDRLARVDTTVTPPASPSTPPASADKMASTRPAEPVATDTRKTVARAGPDVDESPRPEAKAADRGAGQFAAAERVAGQVAAAAPPAAAAAAAEHEGLDSRALDSRTNVAPAKVGGLAESAAVAWRVISMEEAVKLLGGQIRLIDGLTPDRVETGPGTAVAGADPGLPLVRVIYASGAVTLDQQRPGAALSARRETAASAVGGPAPGAMTGMVTGWQERAGILFVVTGAVSADSLRVLGARVR